MAGHAFGPAWRHSILHGAVAVFLTLSLWVSGYLQGIENKTFDLRAKIAAHPSTATSSIVLVAVDQDSQDWVADNMGIVWPWPRQLFGAIIDNCRRRGAMAIGFDVLFTEYSAAGVSDDKALVEAIKRAGSFALGSVFPTNNSAKYSRWPDSIPRPTLNVQAAETKKSTLPEYSWATFPISEIGSTVRVLCNVHQDGDADGIYRRVFPLVFFDGSPLPNLGLGVYLAAHPDADIRISGDSITLDGRTIPLDQNGAAILHYRGPQKTHMMLKAASFIRQEMRIINGELDPADVKQDLAGKYILFGFTAPGLHDLRPAPTDGVFSGVEINATMLDNFLADDFIRPMPQGWTIGLVIAFTFLALFSLSQLSSLRNKIIGVTCFAFALPALSLILYRKGFDFTLVPIQISVMTAMTLSIVQGYFMTLGRERFIRHSFKHYLSPVVIDQMINQPELLKLGGERKELTMFFSDLQGFTKMSEGLEPVAVIHLLNEYLTEMAAIIMEEDGLVDKFVGDAIVAFWNAPLDIPDHAERAVRAALRCQERLNAIRPDFHARYGKELIMRIGLNTGMVAVGNMGSATRFNYTVLGDAVNLAARLEGANKYFGTYTMISQDTRSQLGEQFQCRELGRLRVVGRTEPVTVFEPLSGATSQEYAVFGKGLQHFYAGKFQEALVDFSEVSAADPAAAAYVRLCETMMKNPPEQWNGVFELRSK